SWSIEENSITYRLLVILRPPPGHSFSLDTTEQPPAGRSGIRVALKCLCSREQLLGKTPCFLHPSGQDHRLDLLDTLCTRSYLDVEHVTCWVQMLVASAWQLLPHSLHCQLTVLPSHRSCRFQLTGSSGMQSSIEMALAVQE
ncbi:IPIL1 protein, partial [Menura novaehollandiae]|nr:IPIL1 protein [Menura novaehollandiae]